MRLSRNHSACLLLAAPLATLSLVQSASAATDNWGTPLTLGPAAPAGQKSMFPRVGITSTGRGTVAWNDGGIIFSRDFTVGGTLGTGLSVAKGSLATSVARDKSGNAVVSGQTAGNPSVAWAATRPKDSSTWTYRSLATGTAVNAPAAFGLQSGFLVTSTKSFLPTTSTLLPTAAVFGLTVTPGAPIPIGKAMSGVETGDFAHGADGSNWALGSDGHAFTAGRRETSLPKNGKAPKSVAALLRVGKNPTRSTISGVSRFGAPSVSTAGGAIAVAGLQVQQGSAIVERGVPAYAVGTDGEVGELVTIDDVPDRRGLEVTVAARAGGGAYVTWLQQTTSKPTDLAGTPNWALVNSSGDVVDSGTLSSAKDARDLRVVRAGNVAVAVWVTGADKTAKWNAAKIGEEGVKALGSPGGNPVGRIVGGLNTSQLTSNGRIVALTFVDATTGGVRVATQRIS